MVSRRDVVGGGPAAEGPSAVILRYARAVDDRDWATLQSCFSDRARIVGTLVEDDVAPYLVALRRSLDPFSATMHVMSNQYIEYSDSPDTAHIETYAVAYHVASGSTDTTPTLTVGVVYRDTMVVENDAWKILHRQVVSKWKSEASS